MSFQGRNQKSETYLSVFENEHVNFVVLLQKLEIQLHRLLTSENVPNFVENLLRLLRARDMSFFVLQRVNQLTPSPSGSSVLTASKKS